MYFSSADEQEILKTILSIISGGIGPIFSLDSAKWVKRINIGMKVPCRLIVNIGGDI